MSQITFGATSARPPGRSLAGSVASAIEGVLSQADRVPPGAMRFLIAGGLSSLVNWFARFPLSHVLPYGVAVALAYTIGMAAGFGLYRSWVFPGSNLSLRAQIWRFILVNCAGLTSVVIAAQALVALIGMTGLVGRPVAEAIGHGVAIVAGALVNFAGHRAVTFARSAMGRPSPAAARVAVERQAR